MAEQLPEFETDSELVEWFETADLSSFALDDVLRVAAEHVSLTIEEEWSPTGNGSTGNGSTGETVEASSSFDGEALAAG